MVAPTKSPSLEMMMRFTSISAAIALVLVSMGTALYGQRADQQIDPRSVAFVEQGRKAQAAGQLEAAVDAYETALVVDPRNRQAFIGLGEVSRAQGMPGKAIRMYREALAIAPDDITALRGQGEAMVQRGATGRAQENLAQIKKLCAEATCPAATELAAVIAKGPPATATARAEKPTVIPDKPETQAK